MHVCKSSSECVLLESTGLTLTLHQYMLSNIESVDSFLFMTFSCSPCVNFLD